MWSAWLPPRVSLCRSGVSTPGVSATEQSKTEQGDSTGSPVVRAREAQAQTPVNTNGLKCFFRLAPCFLCVLAPPGRANASCLLCLQGDAHRRTQAQRLYLLLKVAGSAVKPSPAHLIQISCSDVPAQPHAGRKLCSRMPTTQDGLTASPDKSTSTKGLQKINWLLFLTSDLIFKAKMAPASQM